MRRRFWVLGGIAGGAAALFLAFGGAVYSQRREGETLSQRLAREAQIQEATANLVLRALGPAVRDQIARGNQVAIPGLGTFRVVRIPQHRDLRNGRPVIINERKYVEFIPAAALDDAANSAAARPAVTVPPFEYNPLPTQTPSQHTPKIRAAGPRER